jgi:hypothetical protein
VLAFVPAARGQASTRPATMRLKRYVVKDDQMFKGTAIFTGIMPEDWTEKGGVTWRMDLGIPDLIQMHWGDAQDVNAFDLYPYLSFYWNPRAAGQGFQPGQTYMGSIIKEPPSDQFDAIAKVIIPFFRPELANAKVADKQRLPDVAKAEYAQDSKMISPQAAALEVWAGNETFEYDLHGQTVQEIVTLTLVETLNRRFGYYGWSISNASSVRAIKGATDPLKPIHDVIFQSIQSNPVWYKDVADLLRSRQKQLAANQQANFNAIESRIASQTAANDAEDQSFNQHMSDLDRQSDAQADIQRQVSPWKDSDGTSYKLPTQYGYAWSGADGTIIMNNDPQYNPNSDPSLTPTTWTPMQQAGN